MPFQLRYPKSLTLKQLNRRIRNDEGAAGAVTKIGRDESKSLADFDEGAPPDGELLLVEASAAAGDKRKDHTFICKGEVWIESQPKLVAAFRAD